MEQFKTNQKSKRNTKKTNLYMYKNTTTPGVLVETGFLSNPYERGLLQSKDYQEKLAYSITEGIKDYLREIEKQSPLENYEF